MGDLLAGWLGVSIAFWTDPSRFMTEASVLLRQHDCWHHPLQSLQVARPLCPQQTTPSHLSD
jgi:hypothetical protein